MMLDRIINWLDNQISSRHEIDIINNDNRMSITN